MLARTIRVAPKPFQKLNTTSRSLSRTVVYRQEMEQDLLFDNKNGTQIITLNRPDQLNALNLSMVRKLTPNYRLRILSEDQKIKTFILKGAGNKAFCAGGDIKAIAKSKDPTFFREEYELNHLIGTMPKPHVAIIDGITMGGGVGLSVHGSHRIATETTMFAMPETAIGFFTDVGGSYFLPRLPRHLGMYLGLTGARLKGKQVLAAGIATHYVERSALPELENLIIETNTEDPKHLSQILSEKYPIEGASTLLEDLIPDIDKIDRIFSGKTVKEIMKSLEALGNDEWAINSLKAMRAASPTSLRVVHRQITLGKHMTFKECFLMEEGIAYQMMKGHDFFEGVRALLIDKDKNPKWQPPTLDQVERKTIDEYFVVVQDRVNKYIDPLDPDA
jgi:enoyl-CoA hydratase/carnithine racemase